MTDQPTNRPADYGRTTRALATAVGILALAVLLLLAPALVTQPEIARAGCCSPPPGERCCSTEGCFFCDQGDPGDSDPPGPVATQVIQPTQPAPGGETPGPGGGETPEPASTAQPLPTWTPPPNAPSGRYAWGCVCGGPTTAGCPNCASILYWMLEDPNQSTIAFLIVSITCRDNCGGTPTPGPTPGPPQPTPVPDWPCLNEPPIVDGGIVRQPCSEWPGWYIDVEVAIPPAAAVVNPWPRSLCGLETSFWYLGASNIEAFSEEKALACNGVDYGRAYSEPQFDCGGTVGQVGEGARVNYQIGATWRQWRRGEPAVFGWYPLDEAVWTIPDREWNGGTQTFAVGRGERLGYTFETSSWMPNPNMTPGQEDYCEEHDCVSGLGLDGPQWNTTCQENDCRCAERVGDPLGAPAYHVTLNTFWWPEYIYRYDEYYCSASSWSGCWGPYPPPGYPVGQPSRGCDGNGDGQNDPGYYEVQRCSEWRWRNVTSPLNCTTVNPRTGWCMYDLRKLGADPLVGSTKSITAGAWPDGTRCGPGGTDCCPWYDNWPYYVPVPVIELQPGGPGWADQPAPR